MTQLVTVVGSLATLDLTAASGTVRVSIYRAPGGAAMESTPLPGTPLPGPEYAPTGYIGVRDIPIDSDGSWGGALPWEAGGIYAVDVPGDGVRFLVMGSGAGQYAADATVNFRSLPDWTELVEEPSTLTAIIADAVATYFAEHPPSGGGGPITADAITDATATGKSLIRAAGNAAARAAIGAGTSNLAVGPTAADAKAGDWAPSWGEVTGKPATFTPSAHASAHAAGGSDALTLTAAQLSDLTETVQDIVGALIVGGTNVTVTYNDAAGTFTVNAAAGGGTTDPEIVRDVIGGALVAGAGVQITVNDAADTITIASTAVLPTRQVATGTGLTGGGDLSADRILAVDFVASGAASASKAVRADDSRLSDARTPVAHTHPAAQVSDSTAVGRSVLTAADAATARAAIGAGTSSLGAHKATHAIGGTDALTPADIGAQAGLAGAASPEGAVAASPGTMYYESSRDLVWRKATGAGTTGWVVQAGDTGWRAIVVWTSAGAVTTGALLTGWKGKTGAAGSIKICRRGSQVWSLLTNLAIATASTATAPVAIPAGFAADSVTITGVQAVPARSSANAMKMTAMTPALEPLYPGTSVDDYHSQTLLTWTTTDAWPTAYPGIPG